MRGFGAKHLQDFRPDTLRILNDLIRPEAHNAPTFAFHHCGAMRVGLDLKGVMIAVDLDHDLPRYAGKVGKVRSDGMLPAEFRTAQAAIPEKFPNLTFGPAAVAAQVAGSFGGGFVLGHDPLT